MAVIDQERGKALLEMQAWKCSDDLRQLPSLIARLQIWTVDISTGTQGDEHGFWPGTSRDGISTIVQDDAMPDDIGVGGAEAIVQREVLRGIRPIGFEGLCGTGEGGQQPEIMQCCSRKGVVGVKGQPLILQRKRAEQEGAHTMIEQILRTGLSCELGRTHGHFGAWYRDTGHLCR